MKKNTVFALLGVAAVVGVALYLYNRNKSQPKPPETAVKPSKPEETKTT